MEFFEKIGKKASETYKSAAEKTNKIANETKLKFKINDNKSKINDLYKEIGKKAYEKYVLNGNLVIKDEVAEELENIQRLADEIKEYEKQILELSNIKLCVKCSSQMDLHAKFCPSCGTEQPENAEVAETVEVVEKAENIQATEVPERIEEVKDNQDIENNNSEIEQNNNEANNSCEQNNNFEEKLVEESPNEPQE